MTTTKLPTPANTIPCDELAACMLERYDRVHVKIAGEWSRAEVVRVEQDMSDTWVIVDVCGVYGPEARTEVGLGAVRVDA